MQQLSKSIIIACSLIFVGACQAERLDTPTWVGEGLPVEISAKTSLDTRTSLADMGDMSAFRFNGGDRIGFFAEDIQTNLAFQCADAGVGSFTGCLDTATEEQREYHSSMRYFAYYPYSSSAGTEASALKGTLPSIQSASFDSNADYLVADIVEDVYDINDFPKLSFTFSHHLFAIVKLSITNSSDELADEKILSIGLKSSGSVLAGSFTFDITHPGNDVIFSAEPTELSNGVMVCYDVSDRPILDVGKTHVVYAVVNAADFASGTLKMVVETTNYHFSIETKKDISLSKNQVTVFPTVDVSDSEKVLQSSNHFLSFSLSDGVKEYSAFEINETAVRIHVPNSTDLSSMTAYFTVRDGASVTADEIVQISGEGERDYRDFGNPQKYVVTGLDGESREYTIQLFNLPVVFISTPLPITSKERWQTNCSVSILEDNGAKTDYGSSVEVKGRGNTTWAGAKKPYTIKLNKKASVLGMPKDKRWNFLANYYDSSDIRNDIALEMGRRSPGLAWTSKGKFVELIMNGESMGNYYVCEHIKISSDRVNINEQDEDVEVTKPDDFDYTGGYLLEFDTNYDEVNKFKSAVCNYPINLKSPDWAGYKMDYITTWINTLETMLSEGDPKYKSLLDLDSFVDYWLVSEIVYNFELMHPKSCYMFKDRDISPIIDNKIHAGPLWDFDFSIPIDDKTVWTAKNRIWYSYLFNYPEFVDRVKRRWSEQKDSYSDVVETFIPAIALTVKSSVARDKGLWNSKINVYAEYDSLVENIQSFLRNRIAWMDEQINTLVVNYDDRYTDENEDFSGQGDKTGDFGFGF